MAEIVSKIGDFTLYHEPSIAGVQIAATKDGAQYGRYLTVWSHAAAYLTDYCNKGDYAYLTGYYYLYTPKETSIVETFYQTTYGGYCIEPDRELGSKEQDWAATGERITLKSNVAYQTEAQRLVNKIIRNNIQIVQNNLVCARYANKFTTQQQQRIRDLQNRVQERQEYIQKQGFCGQIKTSYPKGYVDLDAYLTKLMAGESVGIATWAIVIIAAVVISSIGTAAYFAYKSLAEESEKDVKFSKELTAILAQKLTPEEYQQLLNETKGIVTKAKIKQAVGSYWRVLTYAAFAVAGFVGYKFIQKYVVS